VAKKIYIVAVRSDKRGQVSPQWADQLRAIAGVEVQESQPDQARIAADEPGIRAVRAKLNEAFLIEEEYPRSYSSTA
jgi:hypothetical protein